MVPSMSKTVCLNASGSHYGYFKRPHGRLVGFLGVSFSYMVEKAKFSFSRAIAQFMKILIQSMRAISTWRNKALEQLRIQAQVLYLLLHVKYFLYILTWRMQGFVNAADEADEGYKYFSRVMSYSRHQLFMCARVFRGGCKGGRE